MHDVDRRERTGGETSPDALRERTPYNGCDIAHVPSNCLMDEGEEKVEDEEQTKAGGEDRHEAIKKTEEIDDQNVAAGVFGCAYSNGSPICRFVKASPDNQSHKNVHSSGSPTCGHCSCTEPRSCTEPLASVSTSKTHV